MSRAYYSASVEMFQSDSNDFILGQLTRHHQFALEDLQRNAWIAQISILKTVLTQLPGCHLAFEYAIPRMGKRVNPPPPDTGAPHREIKSPISVCCRTRRSDTDAGKHSARRRSRAEVQDAAGYDPIAARAKATSFINGLEHYVKYNHNHRPCLRYYPASLHSVICVSDRRAGRRHTGTLATVTNRRRDGLVICRTCLA